MPVMIAELIPDIPANYSKDDKENRTSYREHRPEDIFPPDEEDEEEEYEYDYSDEDEMMDQQQQQEKEIFYSSPLPSTVLYRYRTPGAQPARRGVIRCAAAQPYHQPPAVAPR